jgi:hypothetical protein
MGSEGEQMKKYLALVLGVIFMLGFAASAFAIHAEIPAETQAVVSKGATQITLGGEIRFRGEMVVNSDLDKKGGQTTGGSAGENQDTQSYYDGRVRLRIEAKVSKNTMGVIHLETGDAAGSGSSNIKDTYIWSSQGNEGKGTYPQGNAKKGSMQILEAWILHTGSGLLGVPAGIKVGHMPLALGNKLFFDHSKFGDDAIVVFMDPTKELHVGLLTIKFNESAYTGASAADTSSTGTKSADDADAYVFLMNYKSGKSSAGVDFTYVDDKRAYITTNGTAATFDARGKGTHLYNIGLRGETEVGGFGLKADIEKQGGSSKSELALVGTDNKMVNKGYAYLVGASYKLNPVKLSLDYAFGSGDDNSTDNKNNAFVTALSGVQNYTYVYDYRAATSMGSSGTGITNTNYIKLGANADLTKNLNADLNLYRLGASKKKAITPGAWTTAGDSKRIGTELDAKMTYKIDKNLVYFVEGGYLWTGNFYNNATNTADDAYAVRHGITLSF